MIRTESELRSIRDSVSLVGRLSDSLVRVGPFSLGIDGLLAWIPAVGEIYSVCAGAFILAQGARAGVGVSVLAPAAVLLGVRTLGDAVPFAGPLFADAFTAHKWAARMIVRAIDQKLGAAADQAPGDRWTRWSIPA